MNTIEISFVRIYLTEGEGCMKGLLKRLHDEEKVRGVTVFRGISGFGKSGEMHSSSLLDLSLDLPVVIEFYDEPGKVKAIIDHLNTFVKPGQIIYWPATVNE